MEPHDSAAAVAGAVPSRRKRRTAIAIAGVAGGVAATALLGGMAGEAAAHYVYGHSRVIDQTNWCMDIRSEVSHGSHQGGYYKGDVWMLRDNPSSASPHCAGNRTMGPYDMSIQMWQWRAANATTATRAVCSGTARHTNVSGTSHMGQSVNHGSNNPTCGPGWYENETRGWGVRNGNWETSRLFSGRHCLPADATQCQGK